MEQEYPLANLAQMVASALGQEHPTRLALRNTERFGIVHLYFAHGRLSHVAGHRASAQASLSDLATWHAGAIRRDEGSSAAVPSVDQFEGESALAPRLAEAIRALEANGVISPSAPVSPVIPKPVSHGGVSGRLSPLTTHTHPGVSRLPSYPQTSGPLSLPPSALDMSQLEQVAGLPPLMDAAMPPEPPASLRGASGELRRASVELLSAPQWQLIALVTRQVVEHAGQQIGQQLAENLLRQALGQTAASKTPLRVVEVDSSGWLQAVSSPEGKTITSYPTTEVADAIAALLTSFELRCAALVGALQAHQFIATATMPFRASLAQIGLAVTGSPDDAGRRTPHRS